MATEEEIYCAKPWSHVMLRANRSYSPCCRFTEEYYLSDNYTNPLLSKEMAELRKRMLLGETLQNCQKCHFEEQASGNSLRKRNNKISLDNIDLENPQLTYLEISFSNICDLQCLGCSSFSSSSWIEAEKKLDMIPHKTYYLDVDSLGDLLTNLERVKISGGEPLLSKNHDHFCEKLLQNKRLPEISLSLFSNGHHIPNYRVLEFWKGCKKSEIAFSIDGLQETNDYFRLNSNWNTFIKNMEWFSSELKNHSNIQLCFMTTVNIFNIGEMIELDEFLANRFPQYLRFKAPIISPNHLSAQNLPESKKEFLIKKYENHIKNFKFDQSIYKKSYEMMVGILKTPAALTWEETLNTINEFDEARGTRSDKLVMRMFDSF